MYIQGDSLDEILNEAYSGIAKHGVRNAGTRGAHTEVIGVSIRMGHPRARLSRSADRGLPFSALGELLWYLTKSDDLDFIAAYIPAYRNEVGADGHINGAYGPLLFSSYGLDQIEAVAKLLKRKPTTRRAVVQLYGAKDLLINDEVPCTTTLQFFIRDSRLHLMASLRSNDVYLGLPHDIFCFTMLQEMMAVRLGVELGEYRQSIGSFHLYDKHAERVERYLNEGHHGLSEMPSMPSADPFAMAGQLLEVEAQIRAGRFDGIPTLVPYWADLMRLVQAHFAKDPLAMDDIKANLSNANYGTYIDDLRDRRAAALERKIRGEERE